MGNGGPQITTATLQQIADLATLSGNNYVITSINTAGAGTVTAAGIAGGFVARGGAQSGTAFSDTTDTAVAIIAALPAGAPIGTDFLFTYENTTDADATILAGVGVTLSGNALIPRLTTATYLVKYTAAAAVSMTFVSGDQMIPLPYSKSTSDSGQGTSLAVDGLTNAQICNITLTGTNPAIRVLPSITQLLAQMPQARPGLQIQLNIMNPSANSSTLTGNTGAVVSGTVNMPTLTARQYALKVNSLGTYTVTGLTATTL